MRTLILRDVVLGNSLLNLKCLRVLNLNGAKIMELPTSIGKLKHLRYLDVSWTKIQAFPKSIGKLYNLQTLRLMHWYSPIELPNNLKNLISLRHIYFRPNSIRKQMPIGMGQLTSLQTLPFFYVGQERGHQIEELGCLNKLRGELNICNLEHVRNKEEATRANLLGKANLYKLRLEWRSYYRREGDNNDEDVLEGLQPHPNLNSLRIENYGDDKFPSWMMMTSINSSSGLSRLNNLVQIELQGCNKCEQIPTLGQLPFLRVLFINGLRNVKCIGIEFYGAGGSETRDLFLALERFWLCSIYNLMEWKEVVATPTTGVVFPCLEVLYLSNCPQLRTAPSHFSSLRILEIRKVHSSMPLVYISSNLTTLTSLSIDNVPELGFLSEGLLQNNKNLASLEINECPSLTSIAPHVSGCCTSLQSLVISKCEKLSYLLGGLHTLMSPEELSIINCPNLESIPSIHGLTSLRKLKCSGLTSLPSGLQSCTSLEDLTLEKCPNLISVPEYLRELHSLSSLTIMGYEKLKCLPEGLHCLTHLKCLGIGGFWEELDTFPNFEDILLLHLASLRDLGLGGWPKLKSLPNQLQHLTATSFGIEHFDGVEALPEWLRNLTSLKELHITSCKNLMHLPTMEAMRRFTKLEELGIYECPLLKERCAKGSGPEWFKISHIPKIIIDFIHIQEPAVGFH